MNTNKENNINEHDPTKVLTQAELKARLASVMEHRPVGWSNRSVAPYYTKHYGEQAKVLIDTLFADRDNDITLDTKFHGVSVATAKMQFYQGWQWLRERHEDPEQRAKYVDIYINGMIETQTIGRKIRLYIKDEGTKELLNAISKVPSYNKKKESPLTWKERLDKWLDEDHKDGDTISIEREDLSETDLVYIETLIATQTNIVMTNRSAKTTTLVYLDISDFKEI